MLRIRRKLADDICAQRPGTTLVGDLSRGHLAGFPRGEFAGGGGAAVDCTSDRFEGRPVYFSGELQWTIEDAVFHRSSVLRIGAAA